MHRLLALLALVAPAAAQTSYLDLYYGSDPDEVLDIHLPAGGSPSTRACVVYVHGRGDIASDEDIDIAIEPWAGLLASDVAVVTIDYPGSELGGFPKQWYSAMEAWDVLTMISDGTVPGFPYSCQWDPDRMGWMGSSIGVSISASIAYSGLRPGAFVVESFGVTDWNLACCPGFAQAHPILGGPTWMDNIDRASPLWWLQNPTYATPRPTLMFNPSSSAGTPPLAPHDPAFDLALEAAIVITGQPSLSLFGAVPVLDGTLVAGFIDTVTP